MNGQHFTLIAILFIASDVFLVIRLKGVAILDSFTQLVLLFIYMKWFRCGGSDWSTGVRMGAEKIRTGFCGGNPKDKDDLERGLERGVKRILKDAGR